MKKQKRKRQPGKEISIYLTWHMRTVVFKLVSKEGLNKWYWDKFLTIWLNMRQNKLQIKILYVKMKWQTHQEKMLIMSCQYYYITLTRCQRHYAIGHGVRQI